MRHYCNRQTPKKAESLHEGAREIQTAEKPGRNEEGDRARELKNEENDEVVFPPGCGCDYLKSSGISYKIYGEADADEYGEAQGGAFSQSGTYNKQESEDMKRENTQAEVIRNKRAGVEEMSYRGDNNIIADNMSGSFGLMSVPQISAERQLMSMPDYLDRYRGKYICLDLWTNERRRIEKCGVLSEVGIDFLSIKNPRNGDITMIDLRTVRYISIYCR